MTPPDPARWRALCLGALALFLVLSAGAALGTLPGDLAVRALVRAHLGSEAGPLFHGVNLGGTWLVLLPATALLFALSPHARRRWWLWCAVLVIAPNIENGWKVLVGRARPVGPAFGFPSGHATAAAAYVVTALYLLGRTPLGRGGRVAVGAVVVVVLGVGVGAARLALDAHWDDYLRFYNASLSSRVPRSISICLAKSRPKALRSVISPASSGETMNRK